MKKINKKIIIIIIIKKYNQRKAKHCKANVFDKETKSPT